MGKAKMKAAAEAKKKIEELKKKAAAEKAKALEKAKAKAVGKEVAAEEKKEEEEEKKEEEKEPESEESEAEVEEEEKDDPAPKVTLGAEEKKSFRVSSARDLTSQSMSSAFTKFSLPEKDEGFDDIQYLWTKTGAKCQELVKQWVLDRKATTRIEELRPGQWFLKRLNEWQTVSKQWHAKVDERKAKVAKKV